MKKFEFSLGRVKDYKELVLDREKGALARLQEAKSRLETRMEGVENNRRALNEQLKEKTAKGVTVAEIQSYRFQIDGLQKLLESLRAEHKQLSAKVEAQMQVVVAAKREVSSMEKLEEKQLDEYRRELSAAQQREIAEFVETRVAAKSREQDQG